MADAGTVQSLIAPRRYIQGRGVLASWARTWPRSASSRW